jgi:hypothetical protein
MSGPFAFALLVFSIILAPVGRGDEKREVGDVTLTLEKPGEFIGTSKGGSEEDEKVTTYGLYFENVSIFRCQDALVVNDTIYREIESEDQLLVKADGRLFVEGKEAKGKLVSSSFENRQWRQQEEKLDGITFKVQAFLAGKYSNTWDAGVERKAGDKISQAFGIVTITTEKGKVFLWGKPIGEAKSSVVLNQEARKIFLDGKEVKWPE